MGIRDILCIEEQENSGSILPVCLFVCLFVCFRNKESTRYMIHTVHKFVQKTTKSLEERTEILYILLAYILRQ